MTRADLREFALRSERVATHSSAFERWTVDAVSRRCPRGDSIALNALEAWELSALDE